MQALSLEVWDRAKPVRSKNGASAFFVHVSDDYEYSYTYLALLPKIMFIFFPRLLPIMTKRKFLDLKVKQGKRRNLVIFKGSFIINDSNR